MAIKQVSFLTVMSATGRCRQYMTQKKTVWKSSRGKFMQQRKA